MHAAADRRVWAFESNEVMLQHLRAKLQDPSLTARLTVFKGDVTLSLREFPEAFFDATVMVNVLYALDEPERCLEEVFRVLKPGGILSLSTSHRETKVEELFDAIRGSLQARGLLDGLQSTVDDAQERHDEMRDKILRHTRDEVIRLITSAGFEVMERVDSAYEGAVMIVKAEKPGSVQPQRCERDQIFISYSHKDKSWLEQVSKFLSPSIGASKVKAWDDTGIAAGEDWEATINAAIARASVAVLLVSQDFLTSKFIIERELPSIKQAAANGNLRIIWIPLSAGLYEIQGLDRIQAVHDPNQPLDTLPEPQQRAALASISRKVLALIPGSP